jgi:hypothetical protein
MMELHLWCDRFRLWHCRDEAYDFDVLGLTASCWKCTSQKGSMGKRFLVIVLLTALALFAYLGYNSYDTRRAGGSGLVYSSDSGSIRPKNQTLRPSSDAVQTDNAAKPDESDTIVYPAPGSTATQAPAAANEEGAPLVMQSQKAAPAIVPGSDKISPNPPNGMVFAGSGRYQLYRQGDLTWRLDTETGRSCIVFATDDQWKKPRVYKAGCGRN